MVKHLPLAIKQLVALRHPSFNAGPLNELFKSTLQDAKEKKAETGWLVLTTCTLLTMNRSTSVGHLYRFVTRSDPSKADSRTSVTDATNKAALMREAALKSTIFVGVPRTILSLSALTEALEPDVKCLLRTDSQRALSPANTEELLQRGRALWDSIYEPHADKLYHKLHSYHPDFMSFIMQSYGAVLAPLPAGADQQGNLSRTLSSVVGTACLRAEGGVEPQLVSHIFGLLKARNVGNKSPEDVWLSTDEGAEWVIRTVDHIQDTILRQEIPLPDAKL